jgi:hypothetical protein
MKYIFSLFCLLSLISAQAQTRFYVQASASGLNTGQSWTDAFRNLQNALQIAQAGDQVWVAAGTYYPTDTLNRALSFEPKSGVKVFGGFAGNESSLAERDWAAHSAILSGDIGAAGDSTDNSFNVMYLYQPDSNTVIDGFIMRDGNANLVGSVSFSRPICGGGLYIDGYDSEAYPDIRNCIFIHNTALSIGGGVIVYGFGTGSVAPRFINCRFEDNYSRGLGGGMARLGGSWVERGDDLKDCVFLRNHAGSRGGGFYYGDNERNDHLAIHGCTFEENEAKSLGGGVYMMIGRETPSGFSIIGTAFERNMSDNGTALNVINNNFLNVHNFLIDSCVFSGNTYKNAINNITDRYAINIDLNGRNNAHGNFINSVIEDNKAWRAVGHFDFNEGSLLCDNILIKSNESAEYILRFKANEAFKMKNSVFTQNQIGLSIVSASSYNSFFINCIFEKNFSNEPATYIYQYNHNLNLINCIFSNNNILLLHLASYAQKLATNCVLEDISNKFYFLYTNNKAEYAYCYFDSLFCPDFGVNSMCGPGNIVGVDPMFRDAANGDYSLLPCSPLLNAGSNAAVAGVLTDFNGQPRIQGDTVDIGAYEAPALSLLNAPVVLPACSNSRGGQISISPINGCEPYTYQWQPPVGNGPQLNELSPGAYSFTVTDGIGRHLQDTVLVAQAPSPELSPLVSDIVCGTPSGGSATVAVTSGTAPFSFLWNNSASDSLITQLPAGQYAVTVTDTKGCIDSAQMSVSLSGALTLSVGGEVISCLGASDGILSAMAVNGQAPFTYLWSPDGATNSLRSDLGPGVYTVTATDFYGCTNTFTFTLSEPALLMASASATASTSVPNPNGSASAIGSSGGTQPYTYLWSNGGQTAVITALEPGVYTVTITDAHGCSATAEATVSFVSGTAEAAALKVQVWPNPMRERLEIQALDLPSGEYHFVLRDALGRAVAAEKLANGRAVLLVSKLPAGMYTWELAQANGQVLSSGRVVK